MVERVAILSTNPPSMIGGVERFSYYLMQGLRKEGVAVDVFDSSSLPEQKVPSVFKQLRLPYSVGKEFVKHRFEYDVVLSNALLGWNVHKTPMVHVYHGTIPGTLGGMRGHLSTRGQVEARLISLEEKLSGAGKTVVAVSSQTRAEIESAYHIPVRRVILNAVDLDFFQPLSGKEECRQRFGLPKDGMLGLFMDSTGVRKGKDVVESISARLSEDTKIVTVSRNTFAGSKNIIERRNIPFEVMPQLYNACDFLVFPSRYEGCSFAIIEAMACGLPCIISDVGHAKEIKEDSMLGDFVVPGLGSDEYLGRIELLHDDVGLRENLSAASRMFAEEHHGLSDFTRSYNELFDEISASPP